MANTTSTTLFQVVTATSLVSGSLYLSGGFELILKWHLPVHNEQHPVFGGFVAKGNVVRNHDGCIESQD